jgi:imidazolonepropionase-like amidohydrolase
MKTLLRELVNCKINPVWVFFILCLAACSPAPTYTLTPGEKVTAIVNGTLIDGTGAEPVANAVVLIQGERILAAGARDKVVLPQGAELLDAAGGTILPGFINAHVHRGFNEENLAAWVRGGVTTVRDEAISGTPTSLKEKIQFRDQVNKNNKLARLVSAGYMISAPQGYGDLYVNSVEEARQKVQEELDAGVDMIKISMEDGYAGASGLPKLSMEEMKVIIETAHQRKVRVSGHITQTKYLQMIVEAGVDDAAHLAYDPIPQDILRSMVDKGIYFTPTFTVFRNYQAPVDQVVKNLANFNKIGGKVALGNDYGGGPGSFELGIPMYEIEKMAEAGLTPMQVIVASTANAADVVGLKQDLGTLLPGKRADVLVVAGDPLKDLKVLSQVFMVVHNGQLIFPEKK